MPDIVFLLGGTEVARNDNHRRLPDAFRRAGWDVVLQSQEAVRLEPAGVRIGDDDLARYDLIWMLGMGRFHSFIDRMQLLRMLPERRFVTGVDALVYRHAKYAWWRHMPETHASSDASYLKATLDQGGEWVAKRAAGSYGRDVVRVAADAHGRAAIDRLVGDGGYVLLQRFVPEIEQGEKRTLVAGGQVIGTYLRLPGAGFRANLAAGGSAARTALTPGERALVDNLARELAAHDIGFAAVDTVFPFLMEVNLANPGGLATLESLYGGDPTDQVVDAVRRWRRVQ